VDNLAFSIEYVWSPQNDWCQKSRHLSVNMPISNRYLILQNDALRALLTANKFKKILKSSISEEGGFLACV